MTKKRVRSLPRPTGLSLTGSMSGYSSRAPGSNGTWAMNARHTLMTLGCTASPFGATPKCLHTKSSHSASRQDGNPGGGGGATHPSRTTWSCRVKAAGPAGTSSWDMDLNMASLDDSCTYVTWEQHRGGHFPSRSASRRWDTKKNQPQSSTSS